MILTISFFSWYKKGLCLINDLNKLRLIDKYCLLSGHLITFTYISAILLSLFFSMEFFDPWHYIILSNTFYEYIQSIYIFNISIYIQYINAFLNYTKKILRCSMKREKSQLKKFTIWRKYFLKALANRFWLIPKLVSRVR